MWTIVAYDDKGNMFPGFLATTSLDIAQSMMDRLSQNPKVVTVIGRYKAIGWQGAAITHPLEAVVLVDGAGLHRQAG